MNRILTHALIALAGLLAGCATTISVDSLKKPVGPPASITVKGFSYAHGAIGLDGGNYTTEYENPDGRFYRGPGMAVQVPPAINTNKERYPDSKFPGGLFIPHSGETKGYRVYYYQLNIAGAPGPKDVAPNPAPDNIGPTAVAVALNNTPVGTSPVAVGVGAGIGAGIVSYMIASGVGQIVLIPATDEIDMSSYTAKP